MNLAARINDLFENPPETLGDEHLGLFDEFKDGLNAGEVRAAEKIDGQWRVNLWVKRGILLGFKLGRISNLSINDQFRYFDKNTFPLKPITIDDGVRMVPGGSSIRDGCYVGRGVTCMPPMFINVGAYVDSGTMVDSHALVGSCAQVGKRVHLSAAAQIGGVLEPIGQMPVIIEDDVLVGGNCGVYEGAIVRSGAVLAAGTILTGGTPVYDLVRDQVYRRMGDSPLEIPEGAVVVPGSRAITKGRGAELGLSLYTPIIVKYRDEKTDASVRLEDYLR
jgi:2,3,4,5-tetrahydropyridine-2-carboxylate N-succinyltransferase